MRKSVNKQGRRSGRGIPFTIAAVTSLRGKHRIPKCAKEARHGCAPRSLTAEEAAHELSVTMSTIHRWLRDWVLAGEQLTAGAPWRIVLTEAVRARLPGGDAPPGCVGLTEPARPLGVSKSQLANGSNRGAGRLLNLRKRPFVGPEPEWLLWVETGLYCNESAVRCHPDVLCQIESPLVSSR